MCSGPPIYSAVIARAQAVVLSIYLTGATLSHSSGVLVMVLNTGGSQLALLIPQKLALLLVAPIAHQTYQRVHRGYACFP